MTFTALNVALKEVGNYETVTGKRPQSKKASILIVPDVVLPQV